MKRYSFLICYLFVFIFFVNSQAKPFIGYDKVAWGVSVDEVRKIYNIGSELETSAFDGPGVTSLVQEKPSDNPSIRDRTFRFYQSKLYQVKISYNASDEKTFDTIRKLLTDRYGQPTKSYSEMYAQIATTVKHTIFAKFSPDIDVDLQYSDLNFGAIKYITVLYTWTKLEDEQKGLKL